MKDGELDTVMSTLWVTGIAARSGDIRQELTVHQEVAVTAFVSYHCSSQNCAGQYYYYFLVNMLDEQEEAWDYKVDIPSPPQDLVLYCQWNFDGLTTEHTLFSFLSDEV